MNRLWVQLVLAFTLVVFVAVGASAILVHRTTDIQFRQYITHSGMRASGSGLEQLIAYYQQRDSWQGVGTLLEQGVFVVQPGELPVPAAERRSERIGGQMDAILADASGRIIYDSQGKIEGRELNSQEQSRALPITRTDGEEVIGYLLLSLPAGGDRLGNLEQNYLDRVQRILVTGAAMAVGVGLVIGAFLSRRLTAPLQRLATASRAVAAGDLAQKIELEGSSEMVEVAQAFNDMTTALGESERQRHNMVADVAHELRTPLTVLQGNLRAILDGVYPSNSAEISRLYDETRLLSRLVDDLRELALADAGQLGLHPRSIDLAQVIRQAVENMALVAESREITLTDPVAETLPRVWADPDRTTQVLCNLLINALHHTPAGGSVMVSAAVCQGAGPAMVEISVTDTGEGIASQDLPHIFERFWRADPARARAGGAGLGLAVAQSLVTAHGGCIWAESVVGRGSVFRFTLPVAQDVA